MSCFQASREPLSRLGWKQAAPHLKGPSFNDYFSVPLHTSDTCLADESTVLVLLIRELYLAQCVMDINGQKLRLLRMKSST